MERSKNETSSWWKLPVGQPLGSLHWHSISYKGTAQTKPPSFLMGLVKEQETAGSAATRGLEVSKESPSDSTIITKNAEHMRNIGSSGIL